LLLNKVESGVAEGAHKLLRIDRSNQRRGEMVDMGSLLLKPQPQPGSFGGRD
jgi:hypothetical protein